MNMIVVFAFACGVMIGIVLGVTAVALIAADKFFPKK
jgi:hypothetical protein